MMHWHKLALAGIAAIGTALIVTPASAAPTGFQSHNLVTTSDSTPEVMLVGNRRAGNKYWYKKHGNRNHFRHRNRHRGWDDDHFYGGIGFGVLPFYALGGGYGYYGGGYGYYDGGYDDSWLHCHGRKFRRGGKIRCNGRWHRHYN